MKIIVFIGVLALAAPVAAQDALPPAPERPAGAPEAPPAVENGGQPPAGSRPAVRRRAKKGQRCRAYASPAYRKMVRRWQTVPQIPKPKWRAGFRDLTLYSVNLGERIRVFPFAPDGSLEPAAAAEISRLLRDKDTQAVHDVSPRLVKLVYKLAVKFDVRQIAVISGYRQPEGEEGGGHHADGTAVDIAFSGVRLPVLAQAARRLGHVGVGFYPTSGFVHLDVREGRSYFWVDRSGPGQPGCLRPLSREVAVASDSKWRPQKDEPEPRKNRKGELRDDAPRDAPRE